MKRTLKRSAKGSMATRTPEHKYTRPDRAQTGDAISATQAADYKNMRLGPVRTAAGIAEGLVLTAGCAFLFYRSPAALALGAAIVPFVLKRNADRYRKEVRRSLEKEFKDAMQSASGALMAGYSMENALKSAREDTGGLYGKGSLFYKELTRMIQNIRMNVPVEDIFSDFAARSGSEDICYFAQILRYAKRSGGNITRVIRDTTQMMQEKSDVTQETENAAAAKKWEQKIMSILFPAILLYMTISSPDYAKELYHNAVGVILMSAALAGYIFACLWAEKITDIKV